MDSGTEFTLCIYNTQMRPVLDNTYHKAKRIAAKVNKFDLVCLQECFAHDELLVSKSSHKHKVNPEKKRNCFTLVDSGLITLGNFDLITSYFEVYDAFSSFQDAIASKGLLMTRWNINGCIVDIYDTHMQAAADNDNDLAATRKQAKQLVKAVKTYTPPEHGLIICGDFNMGPYRPGKTNAQLLPTPPYTDDKMMINKTTSFGVIFDGLKMSDVEDIIRPGTYDGYDRCLFRNGTKVKFTPKAIDWDRTSFVDEDNKQLSDSFPIIVKMLVTRR